jgi:hypothetical protein
MRYALCMMLLLAGCSNEHFADGYQTGDITLTATDTLTRISAAIDQYCTDTADSVAKHAALMLIKAYYPLVPAEGICTMYRWEAPDAAPR